MDYEQIAVGREGAVARVTLNRPDKLNALTSRMSDELCDAFQAAGSDPEVRAILLTGAGRGFCAGQDLTEFAGRDAETFDVKDHLERTYHRMIPILVETPMPVIAAVNGVAAGAGVSLAAACDIRLAADTARFTQAFVKVGLVPDSGSTFTLPRLVGWNKALELSMTGEVLDAEEALRIGLVNRVVSADDLEAEAGALAMRLAALPTQAIAETKAIYRDAPLLDLHGVLAREADAQSRMARSADFIEGVTAFVEKREPRFTGR